MNNAMIVTYLRTPVCRKDKGALATTRPEDLISHVMKSTLNKSGLPADKLDDVMIGCAFPEAEQGSNIGRMAVHLAGFPDTVPGATINRLCASGLEAAAICSMRIMSGWSEASIAGGVESMSHVPMWGNRHSPHPVLQSERPDVYTPMGITAENIAARYNISRDDQDIFAYNSHMKAAKAREESLFTEIDPFPVITTFHNPDGNYTTETRLQTFDDGIRADTNLEKLSTLKPAFLENGTVTAGNSSQMSDGAAAILFASEKTCSEYALKPAAQFMHYSTAGCRPDEMGAGPVYAVRKLLKETSLKPEDIDLWEINEAFASQAIYCARELGIGDEKYWEAGSPSLKLNINGGAIAIGHPLGCSGARITASLVNSMVERGSRYGIAALCIGGGMGAAALIRLAE